MRDDATAPEYAEVDRKDPIQKALSGYGSRVATLLSQEKVLKCPQMIAALDDFLGALFALLFAKQGHFVDRTKQPIEVGAIIRRTEQLTTGRINRAGPWMAGFHFNSAMFRIAATYHRVLKVVTGDPETGDRVATLRPTAEELYLKWTKRAWSRVDLDKVLGQVNKLKHSQGVFYRRTVKYSEALNSVNELLGLVEAWARTKKYQA